MGYKKFKVKEKLWSWSGEFTIYDDREMIAYTVKGKKFSWTKLMTFYDWEENYLFTIRRRLFTLRPTFIIEREEEEICRIVKRITIKPRIEVDFAQPGHNLVIEGNLWGNEYRFFKNDVEFAFVSKDIWKLAGSYGVAVEDAEDADIVLAIVVVIELMKDAQRASS